MKRMVRLDTNTMKQIGLGYSRKKCVATGRKTWESSETGIRVGVSQTEIGKKKLLNNKKRLRGGHTSGRGGQEGSQVNVALRSVGGVRKSVLHGCLRL